MAIDGTRIDVANRAYAFFMALRTKPACILSNLAGVFALGKGTSGMGFPRTGQSCSHPNPSSRLNDASFSFGTISLTLRFLFKHHL